MDNNNISVTDISPLPVTSATERKTNKRKRFCGHLNTAPEIHLLKEKVFKRTSNFDENQHDPFSVSGDDVACIYCNDLFSRSGSKEIWFRCYECTQWCHANCARVNKKTKNFLCDICFIREGNLSTVKYMAFDECLFGEHTAKSKKKFCNATKQKVS